MELEKVKPTIDFGALLNWLIESVEASERAIDRSIVDGLFVRLYYRLANAGWLVCRASEGNMGEMIFF